MKGLHHLAIIARRIDRAIHFYQDTLGLTLVKRTVNVDDPYVPVLVFGDRRGTPGTQIHVLIYPRSARALPGVGTVQSLALRVPTGSFGFWEGRLKKSKLRSGVLNSPGHEGLTLSMIEDETAPGWTYDVKSSVRQEYAVRGLHSVELNVDEEGQRFWLERPQVRCSKGTQKGFIGYGGVHHVAFVGDNFVPQFDRHYCRSSYFHDPGGLLCEVATEGPGLTVDESEDQLGTTWCFPPCYERRRGELERVIRSMN